MSDNKIKHITKNGVFYIDHDNNGLISFDESAIINSAELMTDMMKALDEYHKSKTLNTKRIHNIKNILDE